MQPTVGVITPFLPLAEFSSNSNCDDGNNISNNDGDNDSENADEDWDDSNDDGNIVCLSFFLLVRLMVFLSVLCVALPLID